MNQEYTFILVVKTKLDQDIHQTFEEITGCLWDIKDYKCELFAVKEYWQLKT